MSANRLFEILYLLLDKKRITAPELAQHFEVSVRTIYRDIDALSAAGVPVYAAPGKGGGISLLDGYLLDRTMFGSEEQYLLLTALRSLPDSIGAEAIKTKLSGLFHRQETDWLQIDLSRWGCDELSQQKFEAIREAIQTHRILTFSYVSTSGQCTQRRVLPARLVFKGTGWYLQAFCSEKEDYRTFKLNRILGLKVSSDHFDRPLAPPPIESFFPTSDPFCITVRLRFSPYMAYRVYDEFDESYVHSEPDGALTVTVTFPEDAWLYGYLLSFGAAVEILEPARLRDRLAVLGREIWRCNSEPDMGCQVLSGMMEPSNTEEVPHMNENKQTFCQSCGMPLNAELFGSEADGTQNHDYCQYCYQGGAFTGNMTMEEMIDFCVPHMVQGNPGMTAEQAKTQMHQFFPMLKRWRQP